MWSIKSDKECYNEYMNGIIQLNKEIKQLEHEKKNIQRSIDAHEERKIQLKEKAEYYAPKTP